MTKDGKVDSVETVREEYGAETPSTFPHVSRVSSREFAVLARKGGREGGG